MRPGGTPGWLAARIRETDLAAYPDQREAVAAVAARHGRAADEVLLTAGAAEAFVLLARALRPRHAVVVHPQFTEPEAALRAAGHEVDRVILPFPFTLGPDVVPDDADLVFVGNPTNPTSVAHPRAAVLGLTRPGRIVVVDEAFADCLPGERESLAGHRDLTGLVVIRSLTKTWGLAGLRVGYLLAAPGTVRLLAAAQPLWPVSTPALAACAATASPAALREAGAWARALAAERAHLLAPAWPAVDAACRVVPDAPASFVLLDTRVADIRARLLGRGFAVRRGETFPGLRPRLDPRRRPGRRDLRPLQRRAPRGDRPWLTRPAPSTGVVVLVGGGPGADDLITVRGLDRLHGGRRGHPRPARAAGLLGRLGSDVEIIDAARAPGRRTLTYDEIVALMIDRARAGKTVVRLKGGDPFVFAHGAQEMRSCAEAGIPVEVVPGVTSATAAPVLAASR